MTSNNKTIKQEFRGKDIEPLVKFVHGVIVDGQGSSNTSTIHGEGLERPSFEFIPDDVLAKGDANYDIATKRLLEYWAGESEETLMPEFLGSVTYNGCILVHVNELTSDVKKGFEERGVLYNDRGVSLVLDVPVPPGTTLTVIMRTWQCPFGQHYNPRPYPTTTSCFGIGMVPEGRAKQQEWNVPADTSRRMMVLGDVKESNDEFVSCIEDGIQFHAGLVKEPAPFRGVKDLPHQKQICNPLGANHLYRGGYRYHNHMDVCKGGVSQELQTGPGAMMSESPMKVQIVRDAVGNSKFTFEQDCRSHSVQRIATPNDASTNMQLFINCLGWENDHCTYIQFERVTLQKKVGHRNNVERGLESSLKRRKAGASSNENDGGESLVDLRENLYDYNAILQNDTILRQQVDALIDVKKKQDETTMMTK